jgi:inhibitor of KinA sporulation pathway (predicted exonuclease)
LLWAIKNGGLEKYHYRVWDSIDGWSGAYLRDSDNFDTDFESFIKFVGLHKPHAWASINHRSWGDMSNSQYQNTVNKLSEYGLTPDFADYRKHYLERYR